LSNRWQYFVELPNNKKNSNKLGVLASRALQNHPARLFCRVSGLVSKLHYFRFSKPSPRKLIHDCETPSLDREASTASMISLVVALVFTPTTSKGELDNCLYTRAKSAQKTRSENSIIISFQRQQ